jgi:hypothetical protein
MEHTMYYCVDRDCGWQGDDPDWERYGQHQIPVCPACEDDADTIPPDEA